MSEVLLFSYGTLQDPVVQKANFGRLLEGTADRLPGYVQSLIEITDIEVIAESGLTHHPIVRPSGSLTDFIDGMVFRITDDELAAADIYEAEDYQRVRVGLASGLHAWIYAAA